MGAPAPDPLNAITSISKESVVTPVMFILTGRAWSASSEVLPIGEAKLTPDKDIALILCCPKVFVMDTVFAPWEGFAK